jgi:hypothetical protein
MSRTVQGVARAAVAAAVVVLFTAASAVAQTQTLVRGRVVDETGAAIPRATVRLLAADNREHSTISAEDGRFTIRPVPVGVYRMLVTAEGFAEHVVDAFKATSPPDEALVITLGVAPIAESVTVETNTGIGTDPDRNLGAIVLTGRDLEALPDDPDELAAALSEMAGPAAGPGGAQFYVDGFSGGRLPPKESIREIRINSNPFSAEYDRLGFGRIEILTKPGSDKFRGNVYFSFNDEALNARNAFALERPAEQSRRFGGNASGPLGKRSSWFIDVERREIDEAETVSATVLDASLEPVPFEATVAQPRRRFTVSPRFDRQFDDDHTLVVRYSFSDDSAENQGAGGYSLPSRAFETGFREHVVSITETSILGANLISETRLQLSRRRTTTESQVLDEPALTVADSFSSGGTSGIGERFERRFEVHQGFSIVTGAHTVRTGVRVRGVRLQDQSTANFNGTYLFSGDVERDPVTGLPTGPAPPLVSSLDQYRLTLLGANGYRPSQFTLTSGDPFASALQYDVGVYVQDEWRARSDLTLTAGLRYEWQTNLDDGLNFAPRVGFAYAFNGADGRPSTVIRGGFGVFFERMSESLTLDAERLDGVHQRQFIVPRPAFFPLVPDAETLESFAVPSTIRLVNVHENPYSMEASVSLERQLPWKLSGNATFVWARGVHMLRSRNLNAPDPVTLVRPLGAGTGNVLAYESSGVSDRRQFRLGLTRRGTGPVSLFANYTLGWSKGDTDGAASLPGTPNDLRRDYGRSGDDVRHVLMIGGSVETLWGIRFTPFVIARSGRPYNITSGSDLNRDSIFNDRPAFGSLDDADGELTPIGQLDPLPEPGDVIIPRNAGFGPTFFRVNLGVSKTFPFGTKRGVRTDPGALSQSERSGFGGISGLRGPGGGGGRGPGGPGGRMDPAVVSDSQFSLTFSLRASNLLNHVAFGTPSGVMTSPTFGRPNTASSARRIEAQVSFSF